MFSRYNLRNSDLRPIGEDHVNHEMMISCNRPSFAECDCVVKEALDTYFARNNKQQNGAWHFLTRAGQQDINKCGKIEKSILSEKSKLPFM